MAVCYVAYAKRLDDSRSMIRGSGSDRLRVAVILAVSAAGAAWLIHTGPVPAIRIMTPLPEPAPFWYMWVAFPVLGALVADLVQSVVQRARTIEIIELAVQIALLVGLSNLRLGVRLPISGHALLLSYFIVRRLALGKTSGFARVEIGVAALFFVAVALMKLIRWTDPVTLGLGAALGAAMAFVGCRIRRVGSVEARPS